MTKNTVCTTATQRVETPFLRDMFIPLVESSIQHSLTNEKHSASGDSSTTTAEGTNSTAGTPSSSSSSPPDSLDDVSNADSPNSTDPEEEDIPPSDSTHTSLLKQQLRPLEVVSELNRHIVGQDDAKRAVAIAMRNRWRRKQLSPELRKEVTPRNVLMIGPTGCGKVGLFCFFGYLHVCLITFFSRHSHTCYIVLY